VEQRWADRICEWEMWVAAVELGHGELGLQTGACVFRDELEESLADVDGQDAEEFRAAVARLDDRFRQATGPMPGDWSSAAWWWGRQPLRNDHRPGEARQNVPWVVAYGEDVAVGQWGGVYINWEGPVACVACFTGDVDRHEAALRRAVPFPGLLLVRSVPRGEVELALAAAQVEDMLAGTPSPWTAAVRWAEDRFVVRVRLLREQTDTATRLRERFGDLVRVELTL